jgi:hypothetical protein
MTSAHTIVLPFRVLIPDPVGVGGGALQRFCFPKTEWDDMCLFVLWMGGRMLLAEMRDLEDVTQTTDFSGTRLESDDEAGPWIAHRNSADTPGQLAWFFEHGCPSSEGWAKGRELRGDDENSLEDLLHEALFTLCRTRKPTISWGGVWEKLAAGN